ncbi:MAG: flagellar type III secretion system protein FliR [Proteobacteria bacterium]|nr:flagellar type III secretion system protein FliR [Pseudomonadota bacterium]
MAIQILPEFALAFALTFARIGTMMMLMPGLSERAAPTRVRLALALMVTLTALPLVRAGMPKSTANLPAVLAVLFSELAIGFTFGLAARFLTSSLQVAGVLIAQQIGVSFAMSIDPVHGDQGQAAVISSFLTLLGVSLIFATNLHHAALMGIFDSYNSFKPGELPKSGDAAQLALSVAHSAFNTGLQLAAPFLVFGLVFNVGLGILSRMMPQLQVFFLAMPAMLLIGVIILILVLSLMMDGFLQQVATTFRDIFPGAR